MAAGTKQFLKKKNNAKTTLAQVLRVGDNMVTIQSGEQSRLPITFPFRLTVYYLKNDTSTGEILNVTGYVGGTSNNSYYIERGREGTIEQDFNPAQDVVIAELDITAGQMHEYETFMNNHDHSGGDKGATLSLDAMPTGYTTPWPLATPPTANYVPISGQLLAKASYPDLFALWGDSPITGDSDTTKFRLPDYNNGKFLMGVGTSNAIGTSGGNAAINLAHSHVVNQHDHTIQDDGNHRHDGTTGYVDGHTHGMQHLHGMNHTHGFSTGGGIYSGGLASSVYTQSTSNTPPGHYHAGTTGGTRDTTDYTRDQTDAAGGHSHGFTTGYAGTHSHGGKTGLSASTIGTTTSLPSSQSILPPFRVVNWCVRV